MTANYNLCLQR